MGDVREKDKIKIPSSTVQTSETNSKGNLMMGIDNNTLAKFLRVDNNGRLEVAADLEASDIQIGAVEIKDSSNDNRVSVDDNGALKVTGGASSVNAEYKSPDDFIAEYTSSNTITLSSLPFSVADSSQIQYVTVVPSTGDAATYVNGANGITMTISSNVITVNGVTDPFASGDVYQVGINAQEKAYDASTNSMMQSSLNPVWERYTDPEELVDAQDLTDTYADYGAEIDMRGYTHLRIAIVADVNDSENVDLKLLGKDESGGTDEYEIEGGTTQELWTTGASDGKYSYTFDVKGSPFVQLQAKAGTVGSTAGDLTISISKQYKV